MTPELAPTTRPSVKAGRTPRKPQQDRGHERVAAILDACAKVLQRDGEAGLTMHRLAKESGTSIGSLYHFFPDKHSVLAALNQRHTDALCTITKRLEQIDDHVWKRLSTAQMVEPSWMSRWLNQKKGLSISLRCSLLAMLYDKHLNPP